MNALEGGCVVVRVTITVYADKNESQEVVIVLLITPGIPKSHLEIVR
jgi:hypothetical protein